MANDKDERQSRRRAAQELFDVLAADYHDLPGISTARRFGSDGLRMSAKFVAFIGRDGQLIVKLPASHSAALVADTQANPVRAGRNTTREWVAISVPPDSQTSTSGEI